MATYAARGSLPYIQGLLTVLIVARWTKFRTVVAGVSLPKFSHGGRRFGGPSTGLPSLFRSHTPSTSTRGLVTAAEIHWCVCKRGVTLDDMHLTFQHDPRGESLTLIRRADGAVFKLTSYTRKWRVPHDLSHAVTERELGVADGIFGVIAAGAVFSTMTQIEGKARYDAKVRSDRILKAAKGVGISEAIAAVIHEAVEKRRPTPYAEVRESWGVISQDPCPYPNEDIDRATTVLRELGEQWSATPEPLQFPWPTRLRATDPKSARH